MSPPNPSDFDGIVVPARVPSAGFYPRERLRAKLDEVNRASAGAEAPGPKLRVEITPSGCSMAFTKSSCRNRGLWPWASF